MIIEKVVYSTESMEGCSYRYEYDGNGNLVMEYFLIDGELVQKTIICASDFCGWGRYDKNGQGSLSFLTLGAVQPEQEDSGMPWWGLLIIVTVACLILGGAAISIAIILKKGKDE